MPSIKGLSMNRVVSGIKRRTGTGLSSTSTASSENPQPQDDTPEGNALRALKQFCETGSPNRQGDEVLFLPTIVEAAESSPNAAAECARQIRRYLSKDYRAKASWQYNALMITRILADNPGQSFTRNFDKKFVDAVKDIIKTGRDPSVRQMLMEILEDFEQTKFWDESLAELIAFWKKEKERIGVSNFRQPPMPPPQPGMMQSPPQFPMNQSSNYFARHHTNPKLPNPVELANRLEEAKTSAKLLSQVVVNTPPQEILDNDLIKEFSDRCTSASRSIQTYMVARDPSPDNETMESLIDTNEQLQTALNQHQRAVLNARKQLGLNPRSEDNTPDPASQAPTPNGRPPVPTQSRPQEWQNSQPSSSSSIHGATANAGGVSPPTPVARKPISNGKGKATHDDAFQPPPGPPPGMASKDKRAQHSDSEDDDEADPFADPEPGPAGSSSAAAGGSSSRPAAEPYQPASGPTPSYMHRQESAYDHTTMHGGVASTVPGTSSYATPQIRDQASNHVSDDIYGTNDLYESAAGRKP